MKKLLKKLFWFTATVGAALLLVLTVADRHAAKEPDFLEEPQSGQDVSVSAEPSAEDDLSRNLAAEEEIVVHVAGAVEQPGVYHMQEGQRVEDAVQAAVPEEDADVDALNRAAVLSDGQKIVVPSQDETAEDACGGDGLIDLNRASVEQLMTLPGIGEVKAKAIIAYREEQGPFGRIEDLQQVNGVGDSLFAQVKSLIKI